MDQLQPTPTDAPQQPIAPHISPNMNADFNPSKIVGRNEPMPKRNTKLLVSAIIIAAVLALGGGGYFTYTTLNVNADVTAASETPVVDKGTSPVLGSESTSTSEDPRGSSTTTNTSITAETPTPVDTAAITSPSQATDEINLTTPTATSAPATTTTTRRRRAQ